jgi:hypothetical protein
VLLSPQNSRDYGRSGDFWKKMRRIKVGRKHDTSIRRKIGEFIEKRREIGCVEKTLQMWRLLLTSILPQRRIFLTG